jgi:hypothetical protein
LSANHSPAPKTFSPDVVRAQIDVRNTASIALVRCLGFEYVGAVMEVGSEDAIYQRSVKDIGFGAVVVSR